MPKDIKNRKEKKPDITKLSPKALVRMTMTHIWRGYDAGGVSMGRSIRSALLESITSITPLVAQNSGIHVDSVSIWDLEREIIRRCGRREYMNYRECREFSIEKISPQHYTAAVVWQILKWYKDDETHELPLFSEQMRWVTLARYMRVRKSLAYIQKAKKLWSRQDLIEEGRRRFRLQAEKEEKMRGLVLAD